MREGREEELVKKLVKEEVRKVLAEMHKDGKEVKEYMDKVGAVDGVDG